MTNPKNLPLVCTGRLPEPKPLTNAECPCCGRPWIKPDGCINGKRRERYVENVHCEVCGGEWEATYDLVRIEVTRRPRDSFAERMRGVGRQRTEAPDV